MAEFIELETAVKAFNNFDAGRADSPPFTLLTPEEFAEYLYELPTADVAPVVHGRWIMRGGKFRCSVCDAKANWVECGGSCFSHEYEQVKSPWCHSCGAKMDGGAE